MARARVIVVEDHPIFRDGLVQCLDGEPDFRVVGQWDTGDLDAADVVRRAPELALMDIELPGGSGIDATRRLRAALPDQLLAFGQDRTLNLYPQAVETLVDECVEECRARADARGVTVRASATPALELRVDEHKVKQALGNVLDNAIDASPAGGVVEVATDAVDGVVRIAVRDHGAGVASTIRDRLFTPFSTTKPDGVGLGLALAKELVLAHGGTLAWAPPSRGRGSC